MEGIRSKKSGLITETSGRKYDSSDSWSCEVGVSSGSDLESGSDDANEEVTEESEPGVKVEEVDEESEPEGEAEEEVEEVESMGTEVMDEREESGAGMRVAVDAAGTDRSEEGVEVESMDVEDEIEEEEAESSSCSSPQQGHLLISAFKLIFFFFFFGFLASFIFSSSLFAGSFSLASSSLASASFSSVFCRLELPWLMSPSLTSFLFEPTSLVSS
jgi:hypothetical protein